MSDQHDDSEPTVAFPVPPELAGLPHIERLFQRLNLAFTAVHDDMNASEEAATGFGITMVNPLLRARKDQSAAEKLDLVVGAIFDGGDLAKPLTVSAALSEIQTSDDRPEALQTLIKTVPISGRDARRMCQYVIDAIDADGMEFSHEDAMTLIRTIATPLPIERAGEIERSFYGWDEE